MALLRDRIAVVTGGSGIGLATAKRFAEEGAHVFITGRRRDELAKASATIGENITAVQGDVSKLEDLDSLYKRVAETKGRIDVLFANAGFVQMVMSVDATADQFDRTFGTNARGTYFTVQKALPLLSHGASIILNGSALWGKGYEAQSIYSATKAALRSYVRTWTNELKDRRIRANVISPGGVETPMLDSLAPSKDAVQAMKEEINRAVPLGRVGRPEDIASAALFLASDMSSYIIGIDLIVDGGITSI